jgi:hypothetical protein
MVDYTQYAADYPRVHKKLFKFLRKASELRSEQLKIGKPYYSPAKLFEQTANITSISGHWKMPDGYSEASLEEVVSGNTPFLRRYIQDKLDGIIMASVNKHGILHYPTTINKNKFLRKCNKPSGLLHEALDDLLKKLEKNDLAFYNDMLNRLRDINPELLDDLLKKLEKNDLAFYNDMLNRLRDINPELRDRNIDRTNINMVYDEIMGISSQLTLQDIDFYHAYNAERKKSDPKKYEQTPEYNDMCERIENYFGIMYWTPSPQTMEAIIRQMDSMSPPSAQPPPDSSSHTAQDEVATNKFRRAENIRRIWQGKNHTHR